MHAMNVIHIRKAYLRYPDRKLRQFLIYRGICECALSICIRLLAIQLSGVCICIICILGVEAHLSVIK